MPRGKYVRTPQMNTNNAKAQVGKHSNNVGCCKYKPEVHVMETRYCACPNHEPFQCTTISKQMYIHGHYRLGKPHTQKSLNTMSESKLGMKNPMSGKHHKLEARTAISVAQTGTGNSMYGRTGEKDPMFGKPPHPSSGQGFGGKRNDLNNQYFRSTWESNQARVFNYEGIPFKFEPKTFILTRSDGSKLTYTPDFLVANSIWYEIKGYMRPEAQEKINLFKEQYPDETLILIDREKYKQMQTNYKSLIPNWE